jgi:hypothetical protein
MFCSLQCSTAANVRRVVLGHFAPHEIHCAKSALWESGLVSAEQTTRRGSKTKSKEEFEVDDILDAMDELDKESVLLMIHVPASQLLRLPRLKAEDMHAVQMVERMKDLEELVNGLSDSLAMTASDNNKLKRRVDAMEMQLLQRDKKSDDKATNKMPIHSNPWPLPIPLQCVPEARLPNSTMNAHTPCPQPLEPADPQATFPKQLDEAAGRWTDVVRKSRRKANPDPRRPAPVPRSVVRAATSTLQVVTGKRASTDVKGTLPAKHIYVYHVSPGVSADQVKDLITKGGVEVRGIRRVSKEGWLHGSFKVIINQKDLDRVMTAEFWPEEICCREWLPVIPQKAGEQGARDVPRSMAQVTSRSNDGDTHNQSS